MKPTSGILAAKRAIPYLCRSSAVLVVIILVLSATKGLCPGNPKSISEIMSRQSGLWKTASGLSVNVCEDKELLWHRVE